MARESWLTKVRSAMTSSSGSKSSSSSSSGAPPPAGGKKKTSSSNVGILAFEVSSLVSKLLHMWRAVGDAAVARLRHEIVHLDGVRKVVSEDDAFLLRLAAAELVDALRSAADAIAALAAARCAEPCLREFRDAFMEFADAGLDRHRWAAPSWKEMDARARKMEKQVASTAALRRAMEELVDAEHGLRRFLRSDVVVSASGGGGHHRRSMSASKISAASEQQQVIFSKKQEVKQLKQTSLWGCGFDAVVSSLARTAFTILARIKLVFVFAFVPGAGQDHQRPLHRSLTLSSAVHPSSAETQSPPPPSRKSMSMEAAPPFDVDVVRDRRGSFLEQSAAALVPAAGTLGAAALAPRYAGLVASIERMARRRPGLLVVDEERDELYGMLPASVRAELRARLRGASVHPDPGLAGEWRAALGGILEWLAPMAHATMRWQAERSFEHRKTTTTAMETMQKPRLVGNTFLLQTLEFADRSKVEAAVAELLVGLNYVWRFEKEMSCHALFAVHRQFLDRGGGGNFAGVIDDDEGNATVSSCA